MRKPARPPSQVAGPGVEKHLQPLMLGWVNVTRSEGKLVLLMDGAQLWQAACVLESQTSVDAPMDIGASPNVRPAERCLGRVEPPRRFYGGRTRSVYPKGGAALLPVKEC